MYELNGAEIDAVSGGGGTTYKKSFNSYKAIIVANQQNFNKQVAVNDSDDGDQKQSALQSNNISVG